MTKTEMDKKVHRRIELLSRYVIKEITTRPRYTGKMDGIMSMISPREEAPPLTEEPMEITQEYLEVLRYDVYQKTNNSGATICQAHFEQDLDYLLSKDIRPNTLITTYRLARKIQDLYLDIISYKTAKYDGKRYNQISFGIPIPFALDVIPLSIVEPGEYFILDREAPLEYHTRVHRWALTVE